MILEVEDLRKSFYQFKAIDGVTFMVPQRVIYSVIGPNGAGKSTLFNLITGKFSADTGRILFKNQDISKLKPHEICGMKISKSFQVANIFQKFNVFENVQMAILSSQGKNKNMINRANRFMREETMEILESLGLADKRDVMGGLLAHGDQKLLDMAIALACDPELLLLDEPTAGMGPDETHKTTELIQKMARERNLTIVLIEHDMQVVFKISNTIMVLHHGQLIAQGKPQEIKNNEEVQRIYLGEMQ